MSGTSKEAVIIGVSSQDGSYLADLLLSKGYSVTGTVRRSTNYSNPNLEHLYGHIAIEAADLTDSSSIERVIAEKQPNEVYNIASQSVPADSWTHPFYTGEVTALGPVRVLEAVRKFSPHSRVYQATSREIYGGIEAEFADESTPILANNPYGIAKAYAHMMVGTYRDSYDMYATSGILFNHESPRRSLHFVTRKITAGVACILNEVKNPPVNEAGEPLIDIEGKLRMGDITSTRDWGYAREYVEAIWLMLQSDAPKDYVIATNTQHSVKDALEVAFSHVGLDWQDHTTQDERFMRPTEIKKLQGDYSLAKKELGWEPRTSFSSLIRLMVDADLERFS
jgi:GDPmannose 4,6-dehydratase